MLVRTSCIVSALALFASTGRAQVGSIDQHTDYAVIEETRHTNEGHGKLLAIVMWRGELGWDGAAREERQRLSRVFEDLRDKDTGPGSYFGSPTAYGYDEADLAVTVEGRRIVFDHADSAIAILVTAPGNGLPRYITVGHIPQLPDRFYMKHWMSGDTAITVRAPWPEMERMLIETVRRSPEGAAFLADFKFRQP